MQYLCGPRDYLQAIQPEGKSNVPPTTIEVTLSTCKANKYVEMATTLTSAVGPKEVPASYIDMIVESTNVQLKKKWETLAPGERQTKFRKPVRSEFKYYPQSYVSAGQSPSST